MKGKMWWLGLIEANSWSCRRGLLRKLERLVRVREEPEPQVRDLNITIFLSFFFFRAALEAYGGSQARG